MIIIDDKGLTDETKCSVKVPNKIPPTTTCITLVSNEIHTAFEKNKTAIKTSAPFTLNLDGPKYVNECIQESKTNSFEIFIKYTWLICKKNTKGNCDYLPNAERNKKFTK
ncbi:hypothetical protein [Candidatus Marithrix sp. Canyon 246]|uniref:hypothetical protein n=1 Tax=Candidatus Marithrix sp. Canyon 246 TaxID=1827136 RepID=UPI00084A28F3|nr:hypothetical protein [Candidatus Marithrix sp. Canyon 246]